MGFGLRLFGALLGILKGLVFCGVIIFGVLLFCTKPTCDKVNASKIASQIGKGHAGYSLCRSGKRIEQGEGLRRGDQEKEITKRCKA